MAWQLTIQAESTFVRRDFSHTTASGTAADARETKHDTAYDGDGRAVMENKQERNCVFASGPENCTGTWDVLLAHYLISSVTGQKITTLDDGANYEKNVYMGQTKISRYIPPNLSDPAYQSFTVVDPVTGSSALLESDGTAYLSERTELAALGTSVPLSQPPSYPLWENVENGFAGDAEHGCADDRGDPEPCSLGRVRAHAAGVADRRGKRMAKEPIALLVPKNKPKLPWVVPEKGPSAGLAAHYSGSFGEPDDDALPGIIDETVDIDISDPFGFMVEASHGMAEPASFTNLPDYARSVYLGRLGENLTKCINKVFSKIITGRNGISTTGANLLDPQTTRNAPSVDDTSFTQFELGGGTGPLAAGASFAGDESRFGPRGTIYIASNLGAHTNSAGATLVSSYEMHQRTYVHELGNLLSRRISQDGSASTFGSSPGIAGSYGSKPDPDSGARLEDCVFGNVSP